MIYGEAYTDGRPEAGQHLVGNDARAAAERMGRTRRDSIVTGNAVLAVLTYRTPSGMSRWIFQQYPDDLAYSWQPEGRRP